MNNGDVPVELLVEPKPQPDSAPEGDPVALPTWACNRVIWGDCLQKMALVPDASVHLVLCDLPYGTTQNKWDSVVPLDKLWAQYKRILAPKGAVVLTGQGPFTARLILSNEAWFKYKLTWIKSKSTNFLNAKKQPLRRHEDICVFYPKQPTYQPQMTTGKGYDKGVRKNQLTGSYGDFRPVRVQTEGGRYPTDVVYFKTAESEGQVFHPTQKPVALGRYLIRTFTRPGAVVLDNACGSGSFLVAALAEGRNFLGMELNPNQARFRRKSHSLRTVNRQRLEEAYRQLTDAAKAQIAAVGWVEQWNGRS